ncbi:MAG TPA: RES family NAD+ phosphorylase [Terriglobales bacterium]|nr:RES family NAD+ phosphorylase [Terriglobales bacterium]
MRPKTTPVSRNNTHRLIPTRYSEDGDGVLARLGLPQSQFDHLLQLEGATNDRVSGEANLLPGITVHELVFGVPNYHIVNAAFTYARPGGTRFSSGYRGAWYAGFARKTAQVEVAYHYAQGLREINWQEKETVSYRDYLADFLADFHDLRNRRGFEDCLDPASYRASQRLAAELLHQGSAGIVYPSVRHPGGDCIACFRPALVGNVRQGERITFTFQDASHPPKVRVT